MVVVPIFFDLIHRTSGAGQTLAFLPSLSFSLFKFAAARVDTSRYDKVLENLIGQGGTAPLGNGALSSVLASSLTPTKLTHIAHSPARYSNFSSCQR